MISHIVELMSEALSRIGRRMARQWYDPDNLKLEWVDVSGKPWTGFTVDYDNIEFDSK